METRNEFYKDSSTKNRFTSLSKPFSCFSFHFVVISKMDFPLINNPPRRKRPENLTGLNLDYALFDEFEADFFNRRPCECANVRRCVAELQLHNGLWSAKTWLMRRFDFFPTWISVPTSFAVTNNVYYIHTKTSGPRRTCGYFNSNSIYVVRLG